MGRRSSWTGTSCPIARGADVLGEPWTLVILRDAHLGTTRFDDFRSHLGIADNVLASRLARMVETGLMTRVPYRDGGRTREEYRLTQAGADTLPVIHALGAWGDTYTNSPTPSDPLRLVHTPCGEPTRPGEKCDHCGATLTRAELHRLEHGTDDEVPLAEPVA
ncbi:helix-turn-helix domain-containing protein [Amycolatopsis rhabdoformis]|uniref:Helix-turn-helix domain-containing protein n=1 Tax=Amycolatopsis rhabdoformis TaxID=1448059 RepID=A0ABZ1I785_9PSEU|nr:helix-turn-helix domain-containing protein [Amycolatopsis rhabdoformis]WSE29733.1 helix-turn-helix domain-containing protein [Amycolatopsis rhabdoformis]